MEETSKPVRYQFRYPLLLRIVAVLSFLLPLIVGLLNLWFNIGLWPTLIPLALALLGLYMLYDLTKSIRVDRQGIAECTLFGEDFRLSWDEIVHGEPVEGLSPGYKVANQAGETIKINRMLAGYSDLVVLVSKTSLNRLDRVQRKEPTRPGQPAATGLPRALTFHGPRWRPWIGLLILGPFSVVMFVWALQNPSLLQKLFSGVLLAVVLPSLFWQTLTSPVRLTTQADILRIDYRAGWLRKPSLVSAGEVLICLEDSGTVLTASSRLVLRLPSGRKIAIENWDTPNESMLQKLGAWQDHYAPVTEAGQPVGY